MAITNSTIIAKLESSEEYFANLIHSNLKASQYGLVSNNLRRCNNIYYMIKALRERVNRSVFDDTTTRIFKNLEREIPFQIAPGAIDPFYIEIDTPLPLQNGFYVLPDLSIYVDKINNQTINGIKTFIESPIVPVASESDQAVNLGQVDGLFIQNQNSSPQTANYWITGNGEMGNTLTMTDPTFSQWASTIYNSSNSSNTFGWTNIGLNIINGSLGGRTINIGNSVTEVLTLFGGQLVTGNAYTVRGSGIGRGVYINQSSIYPAENGDTLIGVHIDPPANTGQPILTLDNSSLVGGAGYVTGTYNNVPLVNLSHGHFGMLATVVIAGGAVTSVTPTYGGYTYNVGDPLTIEDNTTVGGSGSGFSINVATVGAYTGLTYVSLKVEGLTQLHNATVSQTPTNPTDIVRLTDIGGFGGGSLTTISGVNTNGFTWSISNPTTTPALTLSLQNADTTHTGQLTSTDWNTFNSKLSTSTVQTTVSGSTSGTAIFSQPISSTNYKKVIVYCNTLLGTATYTFPVAFTQTPCILTTSNLPSSVVTGLSVSSTTITGAPSTGFIIIEGY